MVIKRYLKIAQYTLLYLAIFVGCHTQTSDLDTVVTEGPDGNDGSTLSASLFLAIQKDDLAQVKEILFKNKELANLLSSNGEETPLLSALNHGHNNIAEYLLDNFVDLNLTFKKPKTGDTALTTAIKRAKRENQFLASIQKILKNNDARAAASIANTREETPLMLAIDGNLAAVVKDLLAFISGGDLTSTKYPTPGALGTKETPYEFAKRLNSLLVVAELLNVLPEKRAEEQKRQKEDEANLKAETEDAQRKAEDLKRQREAADRETEDLERQHREAEELQARAESTKNTSEQQKQRAEADKFRTQAQEASKKAANLKEQQEQAEKKSSELKKQQVEFDKRKIEETEAARKAAETNKANYGQTKEEYGNFWNSKENWGPFTRLVDYSSNKSLADDSRVNSIYKIKLPKFSKNYVLYRVAHGHSCWAYSASVLLTYQLIDSGSENFKAAITQYESLGERNVKYPHFKKFYEAGKVKKFIDVLKYISNNKLDFKSAMDFMNHQKVENILNEGLRTYIAANMRTIGDEGGALQLEKEPLCWSFVRNAYFLSNLAQVDDPGFTINDDISHIKYFSKDLDNIINTDPKIQEIDKRDEGGEAISQDEWNEAIYKALDKYFGENSKRPKVLFFRSNPAYMDVAVDKSLAEKINRAGL